MIAAEGNQKRADGRSPKASGRLRRATRRFGTVLRRILLLPLLLIVASLRLPFGRRRFGRGRPVPRYSTEAEAQLISRLETMLVGNRTLSFLFQSCLLQLDILVYPRPEPLPPRKGTAPLAARKLHERRHRPGPVRSSRTIPPLLALLLVAPALVIGAAFAGSRYYNSYVDDFIPPEELGINAPSIGAKIYDRNGKLLYEYIDQEQGQRIPIKLDAVADTLLAATIATEDSSFFSNPGVNPRGLARAAWENFSPLAEQQEDGRAMQGSGGSSITQQLVKNVYIPLPERAKRSLDRKAREAAYAIELTERYDKRQILEWYLNQISYGGLYNGIEAASEGYFGKPASELTLAEAALLAGIPQTPARYDPINQPEAAVTRRNEVLDLIAKHGAIQIDATRYFTPTIEEIKAAKAAPLELRDQTRRIEAPHFVFSHIYPQIEVLFGRDAILRDGLSITTSIDIDFQNETLVTLERWITEFETISNSHNGAVVVLDAPTGEVLAYIGSRDYYRDDIDGNVNNLTALNSPGSSFKPFVYLTSFLKLGWNPSTMIDDSPVSFRESNGATFSPTNPARNFQGPISIRNALGNSLNVPAFKVALSLGVPSIVDLAKRAGFTTLHGQYGPAISIGGVDLSALDLTYGYSVLANNGVMAGQQAIIPHDTGERSLDPVTLLRVEDHAGNVMYDAKERFETKQVVPAMQAYMVTSILSDPSAQCITFGCGGITIPGRQAGVKTGTSEPFDPNGPDRGKIGDTWAFGYTPDYVVGVWAGNSDNAPIVNIFSTSISFRVMRDTLQSLYDGRPSAAFTRPDGLEERRICAPNNGPCRTELVARGDSRATPFFTPAPRSTATPRPDLNPPIAGISMPSGGVASGAVTVTGWAWSSAFRSYRLEFAPGVSPNDWTSLGQWSTSVRGGALGTWQTAGLAPGSYNLRVVVEDASVGTIVSPAVSVIIR